MNTSQIKNFAIQSRNILKSGVLNRILTLGFDEKGNLIVDRPVKIQGGTVFMDQLREESFYDAWIALESRLAKHGIKDVCEEAAYTWFNRLVAIRIMQKNEFIEPVMQYVSQETRIPIIVDQARSGRLSLKMSAQDEAKLNELLRDSTKTNEQFNLLISAYCLANPVIFNCFGGIEKHISLLLPDNILSQGGFIDLLNNTPYLTDEDYTKSELIGWLYQFYISEKKDEVFAKKGKYAPDEIPAATQIFTPNWIVKYMVENTIGRIYLDNNPDADQIKDSMKYLVTPSEPTPKDAILKLDDLTEYNMIDNACGSGHILIEGFNLFYRMYKYEGYASRVAIENILKKNIIGLDLDTRAKQLATFALLMTAAKIDKSFLDCKVMPRVLDFPEPFVYRWGTMEDFLPHYFLGGNQKIYKETIEAFELLKDADSLGSVMKFEISEETREAIRRSTEDWEKQEFLNENIADAIPSMKIILALTDKYSAAVMNPPYMGSGRFDEIVSAYTDRYYPEGKTDLFSVFMQVGMSLLMKKGKLGMINMQAWLFLSSFESLRKIIIDSYQMESLIHLGARTFDELSGEVVQNVAFVISNIIPQSKCAFFRLVSGKNCSDKESLFIHNQNSVYLAKQSSFLRIPGSPIAYWLSEKAICIAENEARISSVAAPKQGLATGNNNLFLRLLWEVDKSKIGRVKWVPCTKGGSFRKWYGNIEYVVNWENDGEEIKHYTNESGKLASRPQNLAYYFKSDGATWSTIASGKPSFRFFDKKCLFETKGSVCFPRNISELYAIMAYLNSPIVSAFLEAYSPTLDFHEGPIGRLPYVHIKDSSSVDLSVKNCIAISKLDWDAHETSLDYKENELTRILKSDIIPHMRINGELQPVQEEISYLVEQYKLIWRNNFNQLHENEEELNRQFIEIYGLQNELTPDVPLNEITILQNGEISIENNEIVWHDDVLIKQLISYAVGCWMGRYRLDKEGLKIAHYPSDVEICTYKYNGSQFEIDDDAIIPIMGGNNPFEDDNALQKIINFVRIVFGEEYLTKNLNYIEHCLGKSLENYLVKDFWKDHKKMYQNRPIYWLFSSKKGAFQVLTYMHRMNPYTVEKIRTKYLLPYIDYLKGRIEVDESRGSELSSVERANLAKMRVALEECNEYHDRLHEVAIQAIDFDLDDGVVVNYAKFGDVVAKIK
ncbi:MAG: BREX-1 system adenine-specific DNA-methyltransferase PglX [Bacteroidales bacterium]|nr:BREX-1 system adenine-specific DNA-methyltransferase PglX [Bacteroidales bacterium]